MGFEMLDNAHVRWTKDGSSLVLLGVENWGKGFRQSGDLPQALEGSDASNHFSMLMSHDPTHFELEVMGDKAPVELTMSGHTHGMQMGLKSHGSNSNGLRRPSRTSDGEACTKKANSSFT